MVVPAAAQEATAGRAEGYLRLEADLRSRLEAALRSSNVFSAKLAEQLKAIDSREFDFNLELSMRNVKPLFQKWTMEMLFVLAVAGSLRFNQMKNRLRGISSRTLSSKLQELEGIGLVERSVATERPTRIDYRLTQRGRTIAGLTAPLVVYMSLEPESRT